MIEGNSFSHLLNRHRCHSKCYFVALAVKYSNIPNRPSFNHFSARAKPNRVETCFRHGASGGAPSAGGGLFGSRLRRSMTRPSCTIQLVIGWTNHFQALVRRPFSEARIQVNRNNGPDSTVELCEVSKTRGGDITCVGAENRVESSGRG